MKAVFFRSEIKIPELWLNCMKTFPVNGFETIIFSTHPEFHEEYLPSNIKCMDSNEILSTNLLHKLKQNSQKEDWHYKAFSDFFRAKVMEKYPGCWYFDNDIICLKKVSEYKEIQNLSKGKIIIGRVSPEIINGAVLSASDPAIINHYVNLLYDFSEKKKHLHGWGETGPSFLTWYSKTYPDNVFIVDEEYFYPIPMDQTNYFYDPSYKVEGFKKIKKSVCVHMWSECLEMVGIPLNMLPPENSMSNDLLKEIIEINKNIFLPLETTIKLFYPPKWGIKKTISNIIPAILNYLRKKLKR
mgnify:FL=1|tara:strand:- start:5744 stop:6640 length:897 start_codon:yes stop_codon:yes gene_type:complete